MSEAGEKEIKDLSKRLMDQLIVVEKTKPCYIDKIREEKAAVGVASDHTTLEVNFVNTCMGNMYKVHQFNIEYPKSKMAELRDNWNFAFDKEIHVEGHEDVRFRVVYEGKGVLYIQGDLSRMTSDFMGTLSKVQDTEIELKDAKVIDLELPVKMWKPISDKRIELVTSGVELRPKLDVIDTVLKWTLSRHIECFGKSFFGIQGGSIITFYRRLEEFASGVVRTAIGFSEKQLFSEDVREVKLPEVSLVSYLMECGFTRDDLSVSGTNDEVIKRICEILSKRRKMKVFYEADGSSVRYCAFKSLIRETAADFKFIKQIETFDVEVSVAEHFKKEYNHICESDMMLVSTGSKGNACYPMELLRLVSKRVHPSERDSHVERLLDSKSKDVVEIQTRIDPQIQDVAVATKRPRCHARRLRQPKIFASQELQVTDDGSWTIDEPLKFYKTPSHPNGLTWAFYVFESNPRLNEIVHAYLHKIVSKSIRLGIPLQREGRKLKWTQENVADQLMDYAILGNNADLTFFVIQKRNQEYLLIKSIAEMKTGLITQFILQKTLLNEAKREKTVLNICNKLCAKLGGIIASLRNDSGNDVFEPENGRFHSTMIVGLYTKRVPFSRGEGFNPMTVTSAVASIDDSPHMYNVQISIQKGYNTRYEAMEIVHNLEEMMTRFLQKYKAKNGHLPRRIIVYREGVAEAQFRLLLNEEIQAISNAYEKLKPSSEFRDIKITMIVTHKSVNIMPGTTLSSMPTQGEYSSLVKLDTFLCSQRQQPLGIASKLTRYRVLYDTIGFDRDRMLKMTYALCHLYARCNHPISMPAPSYYAHQVAQRIQIYLSFLKQYNAEIRNFLVPKIFDSDMLMVKFLDIQLPEDLTNKMFFC